DPLTPQKLRLVLNHSGIATVTAPEPIPTEDPMVPLRIYLWPTPVESTNLLIRHKTTRRELYDHAYTEAQRQAFADIIFINEHGHITEGAIHNVFVRHGAQWRTPPTTAGLLPGIYRRHLLTSRPEITETNLTPECLRTADEIWLTN